jgi:glutathione S-transferase
MRRLLHLVMSPSCRLARLMLGEKRITHDLVAPDDPQRHLPVFTDLDGTVVSGIWALVDYLEGAHPEHPLVPEDAGERAEVLRLFDWCQTKFHEEVTRRVLFEKASRVHTGSLSWAPPNMETIRHGRAALLANLKIAAPLAEERGFLAGRNLSLADLALAAHLSALDYYGEVPWTDIAPITEWYARIKSRPSFRSLLADRVAGQPPVLHYAELDF